MKQDYNRNSRPGVFIIILGTITFTFAMVSVLLASSESKPISVESLQVNIDTAEFLNSVGILAFGMIVAGLARFLYVKRWRDQL
jgi:hypothetical protein